MVKAGWSTAFWAGALKNDASGGATLRLAAAAASQADCHTQHRAAHMHGRTRVQRHPNGRKGNLPVRTHRKPEVIRATILEDSPCLPCGLCCTLRTHSSRFSEGRMLYTEPREPSHWRDCRSADILSPSILRHLLKVEGSAAE